MKNVLWAVGGFLIARYLYIHGAAKKESEILDNVKTNVSDFIQQNFPNASPEAKTEMASSILPEVATKANFTGKKKRSCNTAGFTGCGCSGAGGCGCMGDKAPVLNMFEPADINMPRW